MSTITPLHQKDSTPTTTQNTAPPISDTGDHNAKIRGPTTSQPSNRFTLNKTQIVALSGALSGFLAGVAVCPLDVAKTRLQAQNSESLYRGVFGTLNIIHKNEGVRGLYKGLVPIVLGYFPTWMIYFTVYEKAKLIYPDFNQRHFGISNDFINHSMSAFTAGSVSTTLTNPIWVIKTRLMLQTDTNVKYKSTLDAFMKMYRQEGLTVFYSGLTPSLFGLFHVAIHFPVYEKLKNMLHIQQNDQQRLWKLIIASTISKICASTLTYPHEILRTRMQLKKDQSLLEITRYIYDNYGLRGFYKGFGTNLMRTIPSSGITLISFEYISKYLASLVGVEQQSI
ncbi:hypothetical protein WICPIJ_005675 [Wickerhamomyces pijperi]|uniref:Mitochondrial nicotinamide adenine dinucleotide transporter 1 n=1 Tax=Wickerhamomyces pijperi TaxID=599730 RepID=A0A9P8Q5A2_WICPI|nr:hypothetical protein WICPIJ_005675 [Wickerhamomyces pijperi]